MSTEDMRHWLDRLDEVTLGDEVPRFPTSYEQMRDFITVLDYGVTGAERSEVFKYLRTAELANWLSRHVRDDVDITELVAMYLMTIISKLDDNYRLGRQSEPWDPRAIKMFRAWYRDRQRRQTTDDPGPI